MNIFSLLTLVAVFIILYIVFSSGKAESFKPADRQTVAAISNAIDLDEYLNGLEAGFSDIKSDTEKKIIWVGEKNTQTELAVVYIHGFSASRQEVSPLTENLAKKLGANIFLTRLTGHGRTGDAMSTVSVEELLADTVEAFEIGKKIGKKVLVVGMSTGATLATWLAAYDQSEQMLGTVLLSPNYGLKDPKSKWLLKPAAKYWLPIAEGRTYQFTPDNDQQAIFWSWKYPTIALIPMMELVSYVGHLPLDKISTPRLVLYSQEDKIVDIDQVKTIYEKFGSQNKQIVVIKDTQGSQHHVLAGDILSPATTPEVEAQILTFIKNI